MKAPLLFVIVFMIHVMGLGGFVLMQGCATRQPVGGSEEVTRSTVSASKGSASSSGVVMPPKPGASTRRVDAPKVKAYVPPVPRTITPPVSAGVVTSSSDVELSAMKIQKGDSLSKLAKRYGISTAELASFNGISNPNKIRIGQKIYLPGNAKKISTAGASMKKAAPVAQKKKRSSKRKVGLGDYVVRAGDSLGKIALKNGTTVKALKRENALKSDRILVGQVLALPGGSSKKTMSTSRAAKVVSTPRVETISITPVPPRRVVEEVRTSTPVVEKVAKTTALDVPVIDQSFEYTVQEGESLRDISNAFIVSSDKILEINNLSGEQDIRSGMKLKIPPSAF